MHLQRLKRMEDNFDGEKFLHWSDFSLLIWMKERQIVLCELGSLTTAVAPSHNFRTYDTSSQHLRHNNTYLFNQPFASDTRCVLWETVR